MLEYVWLRFSWHSMWQNVFLNIICLVVTGSTDGIGKEYAKQLAEQGVNVVLIARNVSKLIQVSNEIGEHTSLVQLALVISKISTCDWEKMTNFNTKYGQKNK